MTISSSSAEHSAAEKLGAMGPMCMAASILIARSKEKSQFQLPSPSTNGESIWDLGTGNSVS
jgi:hypothetical protein